MHRVETTSTQRHLWFFSFYPSKLRRVLSTLVTTMLLTVQLLGNSNYGGETYPELHDFINHNNHDSNKKKQV